MYAHAEIAAERNLFTIDDVARDIAGKLVKRHPHVFGKEKAASAAEVIDRWEKIKKAEKPHRESILDGVPRHLPSLLKAYRIQQKVSRVGFDWERAGDAALKLDEEIAELKEAVSRNDSEKIREEAGDLLFSIVNVLRHIGINAEEALLTANDKFMKRFRHVEQSAAAGGKKTEEMTLAELDALWEQAKKS